MFRTILSVGADGILRTFYEEIEDEPQEPKPELPYEVFQDKPPDPARAWQAVVALCRAA